MKISLRWWLASLGVLSVSSCVSAPLPEGPSFGRLEGVLKDVGQETRPAEPGEVGLVEITRAGQEEQGRAAMELQKGDAIVTGAEGLGVLVLAGGYRVIMESDTDITIENPSIFVRLGRIIVKKINEVREALTVRTELGAAAVEGTEFVLEVSRNQAVQLTVLEGRVRFYPTEIPGDTSSQVATMTVVAGERSRLDRATFTRLPGVTARTADSLRRRIRYVERTARPVADVPGRTEAEARTELEAGSVEVPNVVGQPYAAAVRILNAAGLQVGDVNSLVQPNARVGAVSGMHPAPGSHVRPGSKVALTIARPPRGVRPDIRRDSVRAEPMITDEP